MSRSRYYEFRGHDDLKARWREHRDDVCTWNNTRIRGKRRTKPQRSRDRWQAFYVREMGGGGDDILGLPRSEMVARENRTYRRFIITMKQAAEALGRLAFDSPRFKCREAA